MKSIALIELRFSHEDVLFAQVLFLNSLGYEVHLICSTRLSARLGEVAGIAHRLELPMDERFFNNWQQLFKVHRYLKEQGLTKAVINTASGKINRDLLLIPNTKTTFVGILHDTSKLGKSGTQQIISRKVKKYFVLNDYLLKGLKKQFPKFQFESFYCLAFPDFKGYSLEKKEDELWICIPGQVEYKRRAYADLMDALEKGRPHEKVKFIILGNTSHRYSDGTRLRALVDSMGLSEQFVFFDGFIENEIFHAYLKASDALMPLIHPGIEGFEGYLEYKISGTFHLGFAYNKALLMHDCYKGYEDFDCAALFYENNKDMLVLINHLYENKETLEAVSKRIENNSKFDFAYQAKQYVDFIES